jgi:hypothetical protein
MGSHYFNEVNKVLRYIELEFTSVNCTATFIFICPEATEGTYCLFSAMFSEFSFVGIPFVDLLCCFIYLR